MQPFLDALSGIFVLSRHSARQFPAWVQPKLLLTANGLPPHLLRDGPNDPCRLLYSSWPSSGLELLLESWPAIRAGAPCARLDVYYGFELWWATAMYRREAWFVAWRRRMEGLLNQTGVRYHGMVGHAAMADAYAAAGFYVYPTDTPETAPINLMKAQVGGGACACVSARCRACVRDEGAGRPST